MTIHYMFLVFLSTTAARRLLINKCCPPDEQLAMDLQKCEPYPEVYPLPGYNFTEMVSDFAAQNISFPWWMDGRFPVYRPDNLQPLDSFFGLQSEDTFVQYGAERPCEWDSTKYIPTKMQKLYKLLLNGTLRVNASSSDGGPRILSLDPEEYCVDRVNYTSPANPNGTFVFLTCPCEKLLCVRKCCGTTKSFVVKEFRKSLSPACEEKDPEPWKPTFFENTTYHSTRDITYMILENRLPECLDNYSRVLLNADATDGNKQFWIFPNGSVLVENYGFGVPFAANQLCVEKSKLKSGNIVPNVLFCHEISKSETRTTVGMFYGSMFVVGAVFLALTLFIYSVLPELRSTPHAKALMSHAAAMLLASVFLAVGQLNSRLSGTLCYTVAFVVQFTFLAAFFWLNVMCIDITWAFSGFRSLQGSLHEQDRKKFLYYSIYAWGSPVIISVITAILEFDEHISENILKPNFGVVNCWFETKEATLAYFYGPMAALLVANIILFAYTTYRILKVHRDTAILNNSDSGRSDGSKQEKERFILYLKLFCLMGVTWITEIISWAHGVDGIYYVTDFINLLRGVFIFIIFCCKPKVLLLLQRKMSDWGCPSWLIGNVPPSTLTDTRKSSNCTQMTTFSTSAYSTRKMSGSPQSVLSDRKQSTVS